MTDKIMLFEDLIEKSSDSDFLREMIGFAADRLMALEVRAVQFWRHEESAIAIRV